MKFRRCFFFFTLISVLGAPVLADESAHPTPGLHARITQAQVFPKPLTWVGDHAPTEAENQALWTAIERYQQTPRLSVWEDYLARNLRSPWTPCLQSFVAADCWSQGRITPALEYWAKAWEATRLYTNGPGKTVGDDTLAHYSQLLASLGRKDALGVLLQEGAGRVLETAKSRHQLRKARESYGLMSSYPESSYRCGTYALMHLARALHGPSVNVQGLLDIPSPGLGFSLTRLAQIAEAYKLQFVPVQRPPGAELVCPALVHLKQNHYLAILKQEGDLYWVADAATDHPHWLSAEVLKAETSDHYLVAASQAPPSWHRLDRAEGERVMGKGQANSIEDWRDEGCDKSPGGPGAPPKQGCPPCSGMPVWWVTEPYINLFLADEPLSYTTSHGETISFRITYSQRGRFYFPSDTDFWDNAPHSDEVFLDYGENARLNFNWSSRIYFRDMLHDFVRAWNETPDYTNWEAYVFLPDGGVRHHLFNDNVEGRSKDYLEPLAGAGNTPKNLYPANSLCADDSTNGFRLVHPDGSQDIYSLYRRLDSAYSIAEFLLTKRIDRYGKQLKLCYEMTNAVLRPRYLIDYDGRTNTFKYTASFLPLLTEIEDPYGRKAKFQYDANGDLTKIIDANNLTNTFVFYPDTRGYLSRLITPYGTNHFEIYEADPTQPRPDCYTNQGNLGGHDRLNRAITVTDPQQNKHLYIYRFETSGLADSYPTNQVPTGLPMADNGTATAGGATYASLKYRNSFYWGPKQYPTLSTTDPSVLQQADYSKGRLRHWLQSTISMVSDRLSLERSPSPDGGATAGLTAWYDYEKTDAAYLVGNGALPTHIAWVLPDGSTHLNSYVYQASGYPNTSSSTFTRPDGSVGTRTHSYSYTGSDLLYEYGPDTNGSPTVLLNQYAYNTNHQITDYWNAAGDHTHLEYDPTHHQVTGINWPGGFTTEFNYYPLTTNADFPNSTFIRQNGGFLRYFTNTVLGQTRWFTYTNGLALTYTNERGLNLKLTWDHLQRPTSVLYPDGTYRSNRFFRLDLAGVRDRLGNWTGLGYDGNQRLKTITNALNKVTTLSWCGCGVLDSIVDALTNSAAFFYDNQGRQTSAAFPDSTSLSYGWDSLGRLTNVVDGAGRGIRLAYNNQSLLTTISNDFGQVLRVVYDSRDRPIRVTDATGVTVTNTFDDLDRLLSRAWPDGGVERWSYANAGRNVTYIDPLNRTNWYAYDEGMRLVAVTNANREFLGAAYNPAGDLLTLTNGALQKVSWGYDLYGRATSKTNELGQRVFSWGYDANNRLTTNTTPAKGTTLFRFDAVGNLTNVDYPSSPDLALAYDALNRLTNLVDDVGTNRFTYTGLGQLQSEDGPWSNDTLTYGYTQGQRTSLSLNSQPSTLNWFYSYDSARRLQTLASPAGVFDYNYQVGGADAPANLVRKLSLPNAAAITNAFDLMGRLTATALNNYWGHTLNGHTYGYNRGNQRTNQIRNVGVTSAALTYAYDPAGQLVAATAYEADHATVRLHEKLGYAYDAAGNLSRRTNNAYVQTFTVNAANRLTGASRAGTFTFSGATPFPASHVEVNLTNAALYADGAFAAPNLTLSEGNNTFNLAAQNSNGAPVFKTLSVNLPSSVGFLHDTNGNLLSDGQRAFGYDDANQLIAITNANVWRSEFKYDGLGRRRVVKEYTWTNSAWSLAGETRYVYDGSTVIQERNSLGQTLVTYTRGLDLSGSLQGAGGINGLLARTEASGASYYYHADGAGNITALMDSTNNIAARYQYDPYGNLLAISGPLANANKYRFSSKEVHANSGLYYYGFRFYEPNLQRWLNADPLGEAGGINLYRFVHNAPVNRIDPLGWSDFNRPPNMVVGNANQTPSAFYGPPTPDPRITVRDNDLVDQMVGVRDFYRDLLGAAQYVGAHALLPEQVFDAADQLQEVLGGNPSQMDDFLIGFPPGGKRPCLNKLPKFGETPSTQKGKMMHKNWNPGAGYEKEFELPSGKKVDAINFEKQHIKEYKPNNKRKIREGNRQAEEYLDEVEDWLDELNEWNYDVETYN